MKMSAPNTTRRASAKSVRSRSQSRTKPVTPSQIISKRSHSEVRRKSLVSSPGFIKDQPIIECTTDILPPPAAAPSLVTLHNCRSDKNKNPLVRLTRLLIEDTKLADIERVGEAVVKEDITNVLDPSTTQDADGDILMEEERSVVLLQRRNSRSGSHLNPSFQQFSPCTSGTNSTSPSPTKPFYYASPYHIQPTASPTITSSPLAMYAPIRSPKPTSPQAYVSNQLLKRPRTSSMTDSNTSSRASSTSSTCRRSSRQKRARTSTSLVPDDTDPISPVSPSLLARASNVYPSRSWMLSNASRQVPQLLNIQGASLAFSKMELDQPQPTSPE